MSALKRARVALLVLAASAACVRRDGVAPAVAAPAEAPHPDAALGVDTAEAVVAGSPRRFPNPALVTQDGETVRFYDDLVRGRVVMLNFAYTRCEGSCPMTNAQLVKVQRLLGDRFGDDVTLVTLSLDPERDTPQAMKSYVTALRGLPGWTWVTGTREDIEAIRRFVGFVDPDPVVDADRSEHTTQVLVGNDRTGRWNAFPALIPPETIVRTVLRVAGDPPG